MKKTVLWILIFCSALKAQEQLYFEREFSYVFQFSYSSLLDTLQNHLFLKTLAKYLNKSPMFVNFSLHGTIQHKIYRIDTSFYRLQLTLKDFYWNGDIFYRRISLSPVLLPNSTSFRVFSSLKDNTVFFEIVSHRQTLKDEMGYVKLLDTLLSQKLLGDIFFIKSDSFSFFYDSLSIIRVESFTRLIDDYYSSFKQLVQMDSLLQTLYLDSLEMLPLYDIEFKYLSKHVREIHQKDFFNKLHLWENDPMAFIDKLNSLSQSLSEKQNIVTRKLSTYELLLYNKALAEFLNDEKRGLESLKKILVFNSNFSPALLRITEFWLNKNNPDSAYTYFYPLLHLTMPDSLEGLFSLTGQRLYQLITQQASQAIDEQDYVYALSLLSRDSLLCRYSSYAFCDEKWQKLVARAHYGIYQSFLTVAEKALASRKNTIAYHILKQAWNYQQTHTCYILTNIEVKNQLNRVSTNLMSEIQDDIKKKLFSSAEFKIAILDSIIRFYIDPDTNMIQRKKLNLLLFNLQLTRINYFYQNDNTSKADSLILSLYPSLFSLQYEKDSSLLENLKTASKIRIKNIEASLSLPEIPLREKRKMLLEASFLQNYHDTLFKLSLSLQEVSEQLLNTELIYFENFLNNHHSNVIDENYLTYLDSLERECQSIHLSEKKKNLIEKYHQKKCSQLATPENLHLDSLRYFFDKGLFYHAIRFLENIPPFLEKHQCVSKASLWKNKVDTIASIFSFLEFLKKEENKLLRNEQSSGWDGFLLQYLETERKIHSLQLDTSGINLKPLPLWLAEIKDFSMLNQTFQFFFDTENFHLALQLLKELNKRNVALRYTKKYQKKLGEFMAAHDILRGVTDYKKQCLTYTRGDSSLKHFRKSYLKVWKTH